ncbi:hypothetical protein CTAYLR_005536 [Chrysophaeum taylorii]|uniref:Integrase core domain-containing protein n=1 Tax=Chrysophaeum taylorii TaxID=2483200 RepID=A0AAD7U6Z7_9STRA|nr:hypothetical protein CTAYLR_005536 [Chrysophaeum taylorii]
MQVGDDVSIDGDDSGHSNLTQAEIVKLAIEEGCRPCQVFDRLRGAGFCVTRSRLRTLLQKQGFEGYTGISDDDLVKVTCLSRVADDSPHIAQEVCDILEQQHGRIGGTVAAGALRARGIVVQRRRLRAALHRARDFSANTPTATRRPTYFNGVAPDFVWCLDSNCKLAKFRIYFHAVIDGFSRLCKFHYATVRLDSGTLFQGFLKELLLLGHVPHHLRLDRHRGWYGIEDFMWALMGERDPDLVPVGNGEYVLVDTVQHGKSTHNTPVEIQWRFLNETTAKWYNEFCRLQRDGLLAHENDPDFDVDIWCLHRVYLGPLCENVSEHYRALNFRPRRCSSRNPFYVSGSPVDVYRKHPTVRENFDIHRIDAVLLDLEDNIHIEPAPAEGYERSPLEGTRWEGRLEGAVATVRASREYSLRTKYLLLRMVVHEFLDAD